MLGLLLASGSVLAVSEAERNGPQPADVCLEIEAGIVTAREWDDVAGLVGASVAERAALFPAPRVDRTSTRLSLASGQAGSDPGTAGCLEPGAEWSARFGRAFLEAGAERMLEEAPTTPGIDSEVMLEWIPEESRVRTTLAFAGPLDIPSGTCWVDDTLGVDVATGTVVASGERGVVTSPFAEAACGRFFDHLPDGGAGEQAVNLLPAVVPSDRGDRLRFVAEGVRVAEDAISVWGRLSRD